MYIIYNIYNFMFIKYTVFFQRLTVSCKSSDLKFLTENNFLFFLSGKMRKSIRHSSPTRSSSRDIWRSSLAIRGDEQ